MGAGGFHDFLAALGDPNADHTRLKMPSLRGLLLNLDVPDAWIVPILAALSIALVWFARKLPPAEAIALAVAGSLALGFHTMGYDILLFFVPLFVLLPTVRLPRLSAVLLFVFSPFALLPLDGSRHPFELQGVAGVAAALVMAAAAGRIAGAQPEAVDLRQSQEASA